VLDFRNGSTTVFVVSPGNFRFQKLSGLMVINSQADDVPRWQFSVKARLSGSLLATLLDAKLRVSRITDQLLKTRRPYLVTLLRDQWRGNPVGQLGAIC
jgi:hypothetical protein